eukprot:GHUV01001460.1.p1 GENE.GHUV01001460.1~~GHUV01001460.1.p1  ORF type:complete len:379 (+),score=156.33 GHUV01001460.1:524-1660(+)
MDSPVLDPMDGLGFLDLDFQEPTVHNKSMDVELSDLLNLDPPVLGMHPSARSSTDRAELLRAALRSHQDMNGLPVLPERSAAVGLSAATPLELNNNAVVAPLTAAAPQALPTTTPQPVPAKAVKTSAVRAAAAKAPAKVKSEPDEDTDSDDMSSQLGKNGVSKRRRRIRNAKQQELNRLAQQRYRERKKQKYSVLQGTVDELSVRISQLNTLEAANSELQQRNVQLEIVVKDQTGQLRSQQDTIAKQAQQLQTQAVQLQQQAQQLQQQVQHIEQQEKQVTELKSKVAASTSSTASQTGAESDVITDEKIALAIRAVLTGVSTMTSMLPGKDTQQMQQMVTQLPDSLLQQLRTCCREVALHLKATEVKEQPLAVSVPCC